VKAAISLAPRSSSNSTGLPFTQSRIRRTTAALPSSGDAPDPSGQVLFADGSNQIFAYTPSGGPDPAWAPHITSCPHRIEAGHSYTLYGRQLNGLSQAVSYGDDATAATNYPLVRIRHAASGKVYFCRTFNHSSMGVATGTSIQHTTFKSLLGRPMVHRKLVVIANGIPSNA